MAKVSIVVPVYNTLEVYLRKCIESILNQTMGDLELILIDDGSEKACASILDEYQEKDSRVAIRHIPNGGVSNARNIGLQMAQGDWVTFVDSDDWVDSDMLERLIKTSEQEEADVVMWRFYKTYEDHDEETPFVGEDNMVFENQDIRKLQRMLLNYYSYYETMQFTFLVTTICKMYKRTILRGVQFPTDVHNGEDGIFTLETLHYAKKVVFTNQIMYHYVQRGDSVSKAYSSRTVMSWVNNRKANKKLLEKLGLQQELQAAYDYHAIEVLKLILFTVYAHPDYRREDGTMSLKELLKVPEFADSIHRIAIRDVYGSKGKVVAVCAKLKLVHLLVWMTKLRMRGIKENVNRQ